VAATTARRRGRLARWAFGATTDADLLAQCAEVGARPLVIGAPVLVAGGRIVIGDDLVLSSRPVRSHLITSGGLLEIGDRVRIGFGAAIACDERVRIGDDTHLGPYVSLSDSDFHVVGDRTATPEPRPVEIGRRVRIGARVMILPGTTIGDDVEIAAGSVVGGTVPAGSRLAGVPARPVGAPAAGSTATADAVLELLQRTLGLAHTPIPEQARVELAEWDSLGALRVLIALEEDLGVRLDEEEVLAAVRVGDLVDAVVARVGPTVAAATGAPGRPADLLVHVASRPASTALAADDPLAAVAELVRATLDLPIAPAPETDRDAIPEWDSFGALKLLLAAEDSFGVTLSEEAVAGARSVADLSAAIARAGA
jgi:acetyltransferase-like isoleucine patch superfamily enzyme/acyl carrier protein